MDRLRTLVLQITAPEVALAEKHKAFGELVRLFQDMAFACAYARLGNFHLAQDAAQEAFISAWQKLDQLRQPEAFPGWFHRLVLTECNRLTRGKRLPTTLLAEGLNVSSGRASPHAVIEKDELTKAVFQAIKELPENERMVVLLFYVREHSQSEIARFLEVPTTTVAKRLYSARVRLRHAHVAGFKKDLVDHRPSRNRSFASKVKAGIYDEYLGEYRFELRPELLVTINRKGDRLISEAAGQINNLLPPNPAGKESESELLTKEFDGRGKFLRNKQGLITHLVYYEFGREMGLAKKIS